MIRRGWVRYADGREECVVTVVMKHRAVGATTALFLAEKRAECFEAERLAFRGRVR